MRKIYVTIEREDLLSKENPTIHNIFYFPSEKIRNFNFKKVSIIHFVYDKNYEQDELDLLEEIFRFNKSEIIVITIKNKFFEKFKEFIRLELDGVPGFIVEYINVPVVKTMQARKDIYQYFLDLENQGGVIISSFYKRRRVYARKKLDIKFPYDLNSN